MRNNKKKNTVLNTLFVYSTLLDNYVKHKKKKSVFDTFFFFIKININSYIYYQNKIVCHFWKKFDYFHLKNRKKIHQIFAYTHNLIKSSTRIKYLMNFHLIFYSYNLSKNPQLVLVVFTTYSNTLVNAAKTNSWL
jgi:hypothetical protein